MSLRCDDDLAPRPLPRPTNPQNTPVRPEVPEVSLVFDSISVGPGFVNRSIKPNYLDSLQPQCSDHERSSTKFNEFNSSWRYSFANKENITPKFPQPHERLSANAESCSCCVSRSIEYPRKELEECRKQLSENTRAMLRFNDIVRELECKFSKTVSYDEFYKLANRFDHFVDVYQNFATSRFASKEEVLSMMETYDRHVAGLNRRIELLEDQLRSAEAKDAEKSYEVRKKVNFCDNFGKQCHCARDCEDQRGKRSLETKIIGRREDENPSVGGCKQSESNRYQQKNVNLLENVDTCGKTMKRDVQENTRANDEFHSNELPVEQPSKCKHMEQQLETRVSDPEITNLPFYNNIIGNVKTMLEQNHKLRSDDRRDEYIQKATIEQLKKLGVNMKTTEEKRNQDNEEVYRNTCRSKNVKYSSGTESDLSLHMNALAMKYVTSNHHTDVISKAPANDPKLATSNCNNVSIATLQYMERYQLLPLVDSQKTDNSSNWERERERSVPTMYDYESNKNNDRSFIC